jgi:hypothetical protein
MAKFDALEDNLRGLRDDIWIAGFAEIENIVGGRLPPSARRCAAWWGLHAGNPYTRIWENAGWEVTDVDMPTRQITFSRAPLENPARS